MTWTIYAKRMGDKGTVFGPAQTFATKREAIEAIMAQRMPKTQIDRIGSVYYFVPPKE